ncbi:unnamed protein product [Clonostachys solani]|uniref:Uncharacterized protein n=1 Tax=Clonostachys solani TaxID=160281 RepID=A0A9N9ZID7_9HYPO|nr:unnamed protein product [Clonostachys solani]
MKTSNHHVERVHRDLVHPPVLPKIHAHFPEHSGLITLARVLGVVAAGNYTGRCFHTASLAARTEGTPSMLIVAQSKARQNARDLTRIMIRVYNKKQEHETRTHMG